MPWFNRPPPASNNSSKTISPRVAVVKLENFSALGDLAMQKIYQLLLSQLESEKTLVFLDLLVDFSHNRAQFNVSQADTCNYLIYLKFTQNRNRVGLGLAIFSRRLDKIVDLAYAESELTAGETDLLNTSEFGFSETGFVKVLEMGAKKDLLDIGSFSGNDGQPLYFFFYPEEILIYHGASGRLEKQSALKLTWERPYYPVLGYEGRLALFDAGSVPVLAAGGNFSPRCLLFAGRNSQWQPLPSLGFIPFRTLNLNGRPYLVGGHYELGKNYFSDTLTFMPFAEGRMDAVGLLEKKIFPFFTCAIYAPQGELQAVHLIDLSYRQRLLGSNLAAIPPPAKDVKRGATLALLDNRWLAVSDYSRAADRLFLYDVRDGGMRLAFEKPLAGEIVFLTAGSWLQRQGFWLYLFSQVNGYPTYTLQFWGEPHE